MESQIDKSKYNGMVRDLGIGDFINVEAPKTKIKFKELSKERRQQRSTSMNQKNETRKRLISEKRDQMYPSK